MLLNVYSLQQFLYTIHSQIAVFREMSPTKAATQFFSFFKVIRKRNNLHLHEIYLFFFFRLLNASLLCFLAILFSHLPPANSPHFPLTFYVIFLSPSLFYFPVFIFCHKSSTYSAYVLSRFSSFWRFYFPPSSCLLSSSLVVPFSCPTFLSFLLLTMIFARSWKGVGIL